jgi:hypothetical protein
MLTSLTFENAHGSVAPDKKVFERSFLGFVSEARFDVLKTNIML